MWEGRKEHFSRERKENKKIQSHETEYKGNHSSTHILTAYHICQQVVPDICDRSVNKRDKEHGQGRSHQKVTPEQRCGGGGRVTHVDLWGKHCRRASQCAGPRRAAYPVHEKNRKVARVVEGECARGRME